MGAEVTHRSAARRRPIGYVPAVRTRLIAVLALSLAVLSGACGGGGGDDDVESGATTTTEGEASETSTSLPGSDGKLPAFSQDFDRVCTTQTGYSGAKAYEPGPGPHTMMLFEDYRGEGDYISSSNDFPEGWTIKEDSNFEDNSELAGIELIACSDRVKEAPTGKKCEFGKDGEEKATLELVNATYEVKVYSATTGKQVGETATIEATEDECPFIATYKKGDTTFVDEPSDDEYINALKGIVAPG